MKLLRPFLPLALFFTLLISCTDEEGSIPVETGTTTQIKSVVDKLEKLGGVSDFTLALKAEMSNLNAPNDKLTVLAVSDESKTDKSKYTASVLKRHIIEGKQDLINFTSDTLFLKSISNETVRVTKKDGKIYVNNILLNFQLPTKKDESDIYVISEIVPQLEGLKLPSDLRDGVTVIGPDSLAFVLFAPGKESVYLVGDFNNWTRSNDYKMAKDGDRFWIKIGGLEKGKEYICQYLIDEKIKIADPYASKISDPWNDKYITSSVYPNLISYPTGKTQEIAMVVNTAPEKYSWDISNFKSPDKESLVIYEVLIRDFTEKRSIKGVQEKLDYIKNLGVNAIELMPFNEFEGNDSWGYNPSFYFATDKAYGTANDYKAFIDACHAKGIAVIMDMVLNHSYGQSPMVRMYQDGSGNPTAENPWYNKKNNFGNPDAQWGYDFNHDSEHTRALVDSICSYWMKEYKIDGFRFDFTKGFSNTEYPKEGNDSWGNPYDAARISNLKRMYNEIKKRNPDAIVIFEHLSDNDEEQELADYGIMLWGNLNHNFNEATMGYGAEAGGYGAKGDVSWGSYKERGWSKPNLVTYMESHDEERIMFKNNSYGKEEGSYDVKKLETGLERTEAAAVIMMSIPGPKMIWQFGELGYDFELNDDRIGKKPVRWDYYDVFERRTLYDVYAAMNKIRTSNPVFSTSDYEIDLKNQFKQILLKSGSGYICVIANFDVVPVFADVKFEKIGKWQEYFTKNEINVSDKALSIELKPGEYRLYMSK